jgi:uncharacterized protein (TIGR00251 family)
LTLRLSVTVTPGTRRSEVVGRHGDGWKIRVGAAPERGRANDALVELMAEVLGVPRADVSIVSGGSGRSKVVAVEGMTAEDAERRLRAAISA